VEQDGAQVEIGVAWERRLDRGPHEGKKFLSIVLDDPSWPDTLNVSAFPVTGGEHLEVVWRRKRGGAVRQDAEAAHDVPGDDIPF
jgi:uncharacterized protein (DUF736 family)